MLTSITLQNFKSFGERQTIPLQPITVLVGPNNSGKSNFMSLGRFVQNCFEANPANPSVPVDKEGGARFLFRRPVVGNGNLVIGWSLGPRNDYEMAIESGSAKVLSERLILNGDDIAVERRGWRLDTKHRVAGGNAWTSDRGERHGVSEQPFSGLRFLRREPEYSEIYRHVWAPLVLSRMVKLSLLALQRDSQVLPNPTLATDGTGLAAVLALWRGADPDRAQRLHEFLRQHLPEVKRALVEPSPQQGYQRLIIEQIDGERFDAAHVSDGVLFFVALAMNVIDAPPGSIIFIEEPEQSIHPRRLHGIVEQLRTIVDEFKCQFVIATHSPVLVNQFRDEPEAIVLFRRGEQGTRVKCLAEVPVLVDALQKADPGEMLAAGFFNDAF